MQIGPYLLQNNLILAPMAGVTDLPFRQLCRRFGAGLAVSEMLSSNPQLYKSRKSQFRTNHSGETEPISVQIAGAIPTMLADAARLNVDLGAQVIDINMGCPAKKVCNQMAGSALLQDEGLVKQILQAVVNAVNVPVTLKTRLGWDSAHKNILEIAKIAQDSGVQALAIHGRTRACMFTGQAQYELIAEVKQRVKIPIIANGDITSPERAKTVLEQTGADGIMVGRAAQGKPWIFQQIHNYLTENTQSLDPDKCSLQQIMLEHINNLYAFYGEFLGVRIARKHIAWYFKELSVTNALRLHINEAETAAEQLNRVIQALN